MFSFLTLFFVLAIFLSVEISNCSIVEERSERSLQSRIREIGSSEFTGKWTFDASNLGENDGSSSNEPESRELNAYKTSFVDVETGIEFEKEFTDINELFHYDQTDSNVIGEFTSDNQLSHQHRNLVILGTDTRSEETGNPPSSGIAQYTVCIGFDECPDDCCCSGYVIDTKYVLTAGHCLHEGGSSGDWYSNVVVWPRRTINYTPSSISASTLTVWTDWYDHATEDYDMGWIKLSSSAGVGYGSFGWSTGLAVDDEFSHYGYPGDKTDGSMWQSTGDLSDVNTLNLETDTTDTVGGQSGGPWYKTSNSVVYATHRGGNSGAGFNRHIRVTQGRFNTICDDLVDSC